MISDPAQSELALSDLQHRLSKLISLGTVHEVDYETARVKVKIGDWITAKLPWLTDMAAHNMTWRAPQIGEQVIVLAPCGDTAQGVILGSVYSAAADHHKPDHVLGAGEGESYTAASSREHVHRTRYQDGALVEYDTQNHTYHLYVPDTGGEETAKITVHSERDLHIECGFNATVEVGNNAFISAVKNIHVTAEETLNLAGKQVNISSSEQDIAIAAKGNLLLNGAMIKAQE
ncbi:phage baseplate assembly protein V [Pseudoalteromonas ardens]|uniref:Gp5/Type VI secretion system Vgr protein OB-fold domain-containing protein n=1 Tax=Pseudoalteromonas rubra TaxID=43658 RepID=A0A0L0ES42_9GAMM|nr:phage baseplate assembly protein V [Pseudoalteromonas sp. R96]KNC67297.1 hypothetical protein AC626_11555 [Pseudoalteromonas rubra]MDK1312906.1 phage baseplate assembly protein V [Pseudoalteromonas sp. R96]